MIKCWVTSEVLYCKMRSMPGAFASMPKILHVSLPDSPQLHESTLLSITPGESTLLSANPWVYLTLHNAT